VRARSRAGRRESKRQRPSTMPRDPNEDARMLAQVEAIFDQRGLTPEERETVVALLTEFLLKGLDEPGPPPSTD
jgi:hypothetical protein